MYQERSYRRLFKGENLSFFNVCIEETDLAIGADKNLEYEAIALVKKYRQELESYIRLHPEFLTSFDPVKALAGAPEIVVRMCNAAERSGVGPMAAVAGAFSELVGKELLNYSKEIIVENGGDIFIKSDIIRRIGIYAGASPLNQKLGLEILPQLTPLGVCTSSGTVGHSVSFGKADAVVILSGNTFVADAAATATGNIVKNFQDIERALEFASNINGVEGVVIIVGEKLGAWGNIKLVKL